MNKLPLCVPCRAMPMRNVLLLLFAVFAGALPGIGQTPGPRATAAVDLSRYRQVLYVQGARGDDIKGDGSVQRPFASITVALEAAGRPAADARVAVLVSEG